MVENKKNNMNADLKNIIKIELLRDITTAIKTNGKSKSIEDYNILEDYVNRYNENPSLLKFTHESVDIYSHSKFITSLKKEFPDSFMLFNESFMSLKKEKTYSNREIWHIDNGYILNIWINEAFYIYPDPKKDIKHDEHELLIESNNLLIPSPTSSRKNINIEKKLAKIFRETSVKEYNKNSIGMISVDGSGDLFIKDFSLEKKFKINNLDEHYGEGFKDFDEQLFKKLKTDKKGLVLLHGSPGVGKTFYIRHLLQRLSKTKKKVLYFPPSMVEAVTDPAFFNFITNWTIDNGKNSILLIEDAEPLLTSRESGRNMGITNLLNLTDGILNDILSIQIIATFNTRLEDLDKALLRPERLLARKEFRKLSVEDGKKLAEIIKIDKDLIKEEMSLAEIYSIKNNNEILIHGISKTKGKNTIGFK